ncbi:MAG TPA: LptA/OstA family protein [bacterium]|nr:LptA/OstA family protein [bacterium]HPJ72150.1 LptA/OstA family protein [bacterium]HPQ67101.1 LptA/OstA family protein [bacterium]
MKRIFILLAASALWAGSARSEETLDDLGIGTGELPEVVGPDWTEITCDGNMLVNYREGWVRFARNVKVTNQRGIITSDLLVIFTSGGGEKVDRAEARGNVTIVSGDRVGTGDALIYYPEEHKVVLSGNALVKEGVNTVSGETLTLYTDSRDVEINRAQDIQFHPRTEFELDI